MNLITTYKEAWNFLDNLQFFKIKLGLDSMTSFLDSLGNPQAGLKFIHVAGTNGKGSTTATLLALLSEAGYKTGIYTSPHLSSVRERFRINDSYIPQGHKFRMSRQAAQLSYITLTADDKRPPCSQFPQNHGKVLGQQRTIDPHNLDIGPGRIGERTQYVKNGPDPNFTTRTDRVFHRTMHGGREHETDPHLTDRLTDPIRRHGKINP